MYNLWSRANQVFFFAVTLLVASCALALLTAPLLPEPAPQVDKLTVNEVKRFAPFRGVDRAILTFDIDYDLTSLFNWNVKQLFVFLVAEYESDLNKLNQVVVYDSIIERKADAAQTITDAMNEYYLIDEKTELRGANVTLRLCWDVMPYFGMLSLQNQGDVAFLMPARYTQ